MARIAGVDLPREKRVEIGLTYIYGIGRVSSNKILEKAGVNPDIRVRDLTDDDVKKISAIIDEEYMVEGDLRREIALNIKRLQEIGISLENVWKQIVILEKRDDEHAKKLFSEYINGELDELQKKVNAFKNQLKLVEEWRINQ